MLEKLREDYQALFGQNWPVWVGGLLYGVINVMLFVHYQPWSTLDGVLNWGDNIFGRFGIGNADPIAPLLRTGSVINIGLITGSMMAAMLSGQFAIRLGTGRELVKGAIGGLLMGIGAVLVRGCNIGGFLSGTSSLGLHGLTMAVGLTIGAFIGGRYVLWEIENGKTSPGGKMWFHNAKAQPYVGLLVLLGLLAAAGIYLKDGNSLLAVIILLGGLLGVVSQRSRVCFVRAFREPFITGESGHTKAMLLALVVSVTGISIAKYVLLNTEVFVRPTFWQGSLIGGTIFGIGMVIAGGCGGGTLWRVGEGHLKLLIALIGYVTSAAFFNDYLRESGLIDKLGETAFLPDMVGGDWAIAMAIVFGVIILWYLVIRWNDATHRLAAF